LSPSAGSQGDASISNDPLTTLRDAVAATAARHPDRVAIADAAGSRSYAELAELLSGAGRKGGSRRALTVARSLADVETILVASCAGESLLLLDSGTTAWEAERAEALFVDVPSGGGAVLGLCSSGSSGLPKVVELEWESVLLNAACFAEAVGYGDEDVLWCTTPLAHLYCLGAGVFGGLLSGASVYLGKGMLAPEELAATAAALRPTLLLSVPFLFRRYVETLRGAPEIVRNWGLRGAIAAGEPVPGELIVAWNEATGTELRSHYGLTEGGQITLAAGREEEGVGPPLPDVEVRISESGEVAVRRRPPGRPYRVVGQQPAAEGWYETGDLGHLDEAGNLHIDGRADSRINVAGKKVDPVEVEGALMAVAGVADCAVAGVEGSGGVEVVAFVSVEDGAQLGDGELRTQLAQRLSAHKLPGRFVRVGEIPRTLTGKVKRGELIAGLAEGEVSEPQGAEVKDFLAHVRTEAAEVVLGRGSPEEIPPRLTFKELGFDSLAAVTLCERLAAATGLRLPATSVFDHPTPAALARRMAVLARGGPAAVVATRAGFSAEPIAIVGMACRYPGGAESPQALWGLIVDDVDAISDLPEERGWDVERLYHPDPGHHGTSYVRQGGFLVGADCFDAEFFGIGPREALAMDPQQRLLLETAWEALENGRIDPCSLLGHSVGVFAGVMSQDYGCGCASRPGSTEGYLTTGLSESVVSGRVAYTLGLEGPAVTVNTACSSSLVATHLACQALRLDECDLALAGGVTVMSTPAELIEFSRQRGLAPDGRCKSFAEGADGTGFSEGAGLLVLERLSQARRNGHRILATIRGSAINQDGASNGLTAPNGPAQERVIRQALANAGLEPGEVDAVEAHGTGTALGDPIEAGALIATYGQDRQQPLRLGSVKSNIGHTQAAAGVAGVIKMVMAMREGALPRTLHVDRPSPKVDWEAGAVELLTEPCAWEPNGRPRRAGVSSFGISGTNAHLILEEAPPGETGREVGEAVGAAISGPIPLLLSARTGPALRESAGRLAARFERDPSLDPADVAHSLIETRSSFGQRAVVLGRDRDCLLSGLEALARGEEREGVLRAQVHGEWEPVFLFPGQGSQWRGMALELAEGSAAFAAHLARCEEALAPHLEWSVLDVLREAPGAPSIDRIEVVQPVLFAVMVSLARLWQELGVTPAAVVGHSQGEIAAAHIAGGLSLEDAARLAAVRSQVISRLAGEGGMVSIALPAEELEGRLERWQGKIALAAVNGPASAVVSGDRDSLEQLLGSCAEDDVRARAVPATIASHSAYVERLRDEVLEALAPISPHGGEIPFVSTVTGGVLDTAELDASYWYRNLRETVRFEQATRELLAQGHRTFIEISPHPVFALAVQQTIEAALADPAEATVLGTLRRDEGGCERFAVSLAQAHVAGAAVRWDAFLGSGRTTVSLPTYPFQREPYWLDPVAVPGDLRAAGLGPVDHPLLGAVLPVAGEDGRQLFTGRISRESAAWLYDHAVLGTALLPGTAFLELAHRAGAELGAGMIEELVQEAPLILPEEGALQIQVSVGRPDDDGRRSIAIHSRPDDEQASWVRNASGTLVPPKAPPAPSGERETWPPPGSEPIDVDRVYERLAEAGFDYGPAFQGLSAAWRQGQDVFAEVELQVGGGEDEGFAIHPALLDSALHGDLVASGVEDVRLPFSWHGVAFGASGAKALRVRLSPHDKDGLSLSAHDEAGAVAISIERLATRPLDEGGLGSAGLYGSDSLFRVEWGDAERPTVTREAGGIAVLGELELLGAEAKRYADLEALERAVAAGEDLPGTVVFECSPDLPGRDQGAVRARAAAEAVLAQLRSWLANESLAGSRLVALARGAVDTGVGDSAPDLAAAAAWGLLRTAHSEHPERVAAIDLDRDPLSWQAFEEALAMTGSEPQLAIRGGRILAPRLAPMTPPMAVAAGGPWRLDIAEKGTLDNLDLLECPEVAEALGPNEVRVGVRAAGLNFRDVVVALGLVRSEEPMGGEGAGVVLEVGAEVDDLTPGDAVMGLMPGAFGPLAIADRSSLAPLPDEWTFAEAASVPIAALTAYYCLCDLAGLESGERVLIHSAAGGVGILAVQLARHLGAEVFATAHPDKWETLRELGLDGAHISSSRDPGFAEAFLAATDGEGVDVVLNSLAGELVDASLDLLPRGGRFLEMGKTDKRDPELVAEERPDVSYRAFDTHEAGPVRTGEMLAEIVALFEQGALRHAPITTWDVREGAEAFRLMSQGGHVGKIVFTMPVARDPESIVLITGGTGGIGARLARHLVEQGARRLLLVSRSGPDAEGAAELEAELEELGAVVEIVACDVGERQQVADLLASLPTQYPLGGVIHAAGALDDGLVEALDAERLETVFRPKVDGAWHLHELTRDLGVAEFVLFSSLAGTLGSPGQGNYAAANSFLDALAAQRRAEGLPAQAVAWGLWEGASGMTDHLGENEIARTAKGLAAIKTAEGLALFDRAVASPDAHLVATPVDKRELRAQAHAGRLPPILSRLVRVDDRRASRGSLARRLAAAPEQEQAAIVLDLVRAEAAAVLGHSSAADIDPERAFKDQGFDSLAAVELRNRLEAATGLRLPATLAFDCPTALATAAYLRDLIGDEGHGKAAGGRLPTPTSEPLAIVGMSCRLPGGVGSPQAFWELVAAAGDGIAGFPENRGWDLGQLYDPDPERTGCSYTRQGGFLADAAEFDPEFFGIAPREALAMDPQQRLLLELAWEALEDAGIDPAQLRGGEAGVFTGISSSDYDAGLPAVPELEGHIGTGNLTSVASGRLAYSFGLEGPAITVDTACSSSLVALHLAGQALRSGECDLALAGGATVMSTPQNFVEFSRQRGLAPDGRCKSFAEGADGTGFSEGAGLLVLERLSQARRNGHRILATIRGSAINQDGASNGLTAPNGPAQERVIRQALANAGLEPGEVDAVEAHGTGTALGDPIEAGALIATYGQDRQQPLRLGSVKSNIGHTQAAAGVAGVIKMVMAMREGALPRTLHVDRPSPKVDWEAGAVELLTEPCAWEPNGRPRRAGVSSFGISGTNAHLILEEAPHPPSGPEGGAAATDPPKPLPWLLTGHGEGALRAQAERLATHLGVHPELDPVGVGFSLAASRAQLEHRAVLLGEERDELLAATLALAAGGVSPNLVRGIARSGRTAFLFTGQGAQRAGMGRQLYDSFPVFAAALDAVCAELDRRLERPLLELLFAEPGSERAAFLDRTEFTQPALFAVEIALFRQLESWGVRPDFLAGHSVGELAAAHAAGVLPLADACELVAARGRLMGALPEGGAMVAIEATEEEVAESIAGCEEELAIAAVNGPAAVVVSGEAEAALELLLGWRENGRKATRLKVSHAFHSHRMDPMLGEFAAVAERFAYSAPQQLLLSGVSGEVLGEAEATSPDYWVRQAREPVRFLDAMRCLAGRGATHFLELGPDGVLSAMAQECLALESPVAALIAPLLRRDRPERRSLLTALAKAHVNGVAVDWAALFEPAGAERVDLPTYAFQRRRYWAAPAAPAGNLGAAGLSGASHPLLGAALPLAGVAQAHVFSGRLAAETHPWLFDHRIFEQTIVPGAAYAELALSSGAELGTPVLEELTQETPLILSEAGATQIQLSFAAPDEEGRRALALHSRPEGGEGEWVRNATGTLAPTPPAAPAELDRWPPPAAEPLAVEHFYEELAERGYAYGPSFQGLRAAWRAGEQIYAEVELPPEGGEGSAGFAIHPALLDAALQADFLAGAAEQARLPFAWSGAALHGTPGETLRVRLEPAEGDGFSVLLADESGAPVLSVARLATRPVSESQLRAVAKAGDGALFRLAWKPLPPAESAEPPPAESAEPPPAEILRLRPEPGPDPAAAALATAKQALVSVQSWLGRNPEPARLALVSENAIATGEAESPDLATAPLWALLRSAQSEHPGRLLLVDLDGGEASEAALEGALASSEPQLAIREGRVLAARLEGVGEGFKASVPATAPESTTLITGGTGTLGALFARHLVERHGARHLLLLSRRGPEAEGAQELVAELAELGASARVVACDVAEREQLAALLEQIPAEHPLASVIHAAGVLDDGVLTSLSPERLEAVFAAKARAAWNLHELIGEEVELILFSSLAATIGSPGQANYAAANAFLDALAAHRRGAVSLGWGAWESGGMAAGLRDLDRARIARGGVAPLSADEGRELFDLARGGGSVLAFRLDRGALREAASRGAVPAPMRGLAPAVGPRPAAAESLARRLARADDSERAEIVLELVREESAAVLGHPSPREVSAERSFRQAGFDSLCAVELRNRLNQATAMRLPSTAVFDHPSPQALAGFLLSMLDRNGAGESRLDAELDRVAELLAATDPAERRRAAGRLRALLAASAAEDGTVDAADDDLEAASDEEMIALIDREFG
jgi:acyl transferase domain-containing protein/NADPH:quinone reductase-like Zn-dependent oxidoreductase/acyl-coenzyme A synthetase/AMP-(fatty) acid ligase/short-subunit dehydrogenase/acyl carrier protein